jgi:hypothetical protein
VYRVKRSLTLPIVVEETINGVTVPKVARVFRAHVEYTIPADATEQERKNFAEVDANLSDNALWRSVVEDLENVHG